MIDLRQFGYTGPASVDGLLPGRVTELHRERYTVVTGRGEATASLKGAFLREAGTQGDFPCVGDFVLLQWNGSGPSRIARLLPRRSKFSRADFCGHAAGYAKTVLEQVVAANFDTVFLLSSLNRDFNVNRILRYLTQIRQSGGQPVVLLTKVDLAGEPSAAAQTVTRGAPGVPVFAVSSHTGQGLEQLAPYLTPGQTVVFLGMSGVGKSSLVNALMGREVMAVSAIREDDSRGRHTTSRRQLFTLPSGAMVIDTPGMRELGLFGADEGIGEAFADVEKLFARCRFADCRHQSEPGCAVKAALADGSLSRECWERYLGQKRETAFVAGKSAGRRGAAPAVCVPGSKSTQRTTPGQSSDPGFTCRVCGAVNPPEGAGSRHRNHCRHCLSSLHLDIEPGDRASSCRGVMEAIGVWVRKDGEWAVIHRCRDCGALSSNRIAADDNPALLMSIAVKPLAAPPFPLGLLEREFER